MRKHDFTQQHSTLVGTWHAESLAHATEGDGAIVALHSSWQPRGRVALEHPAKRKKAQMLART